MTPDEKRRMRASLAHYATTHPVKSGLMSPYAFRYATVALASLVLVLGGSIGVGAAAGRALPTDTLYPVKIFIEEYRAKNQKTPEDVIAFESKRIETRFDEATRLAVNHQLDDATAAVIQSGIEHSRDQVKTAADTVQASNPELALSASSKLETAFSSNGKILAAIERTTNQSLGTIVLAAKVSTEKIATEKAKYEEIVALKPNDATRAAAEAKLAMIEPLLPADSAKQPASDQAPNEVQSDTLSADAPAPTMMLAKTNDPAVNAKASLMMATTEPAAQEPAPDPAPSEPTARELVASAKEKMNEGKYSEALVILEKAQQLLSEAQLTESLEATYQVDTETKAP